MIEPGMIVAWLLTGAVRTEILKSKQLDLTQEIKEKIHKEGIYHITSKETAEQIFENSNWGNKFIDFLSMELKMAFPRQKGFSIRNLKYMKSFYTEYKDDDEFVQLVAQIPWKHNIILMQKIKDKNIRKWYIEKVIEEGWGESVLLYQLDTNLYMRQVESKKHNNFELTLKENSELASHIMKEPYVFDLIELTENYKEKELENKMLERLKNVLLELGNGFSFVGSQYKIKMLCGC